MILVGSGWLGSVCVLCCDMVDFGRFGLVGSVWVLCCDGAERSVFGFVVFGILFVLALRDFDGDDFEVSWKTVIL